ncbi:MAG: carbamoyltransferase [Bacteroidetes bacterium]|nr:carbamoyltransferase [Rhodothermia bacterium]MCX7906584.1 carbamoyltransferase [Bacteroidota bacterium]MDW8284995.1 carbamoyltransferase [Bacteroidota bacterium]
MVILGINPYHADASAAIIIDGNLVAAAEEERFTRIKHCAGFPFNAIKFCLDFASISMKDVDIIAIPRLKSSRILKKMLYSIKIPNMFLSRMKAWQKFGNIENEIRKYFVIDKKMPKLYFVEHHRAHLASSFFVSPFERASLLSLDGLGDFGSALWGIGEGNKIKVIGGVDFPHSLGFYYTAITQYLGFLKYGDEYKVMGLSAYGEPIFLSDFRDIVKIRINKIGYELNLKYFDHSKKGSYISWDEGEPIQKILYSNELINKFGQNRKKDEPIEDVHKNIAASLQRRFEEVFLHQLDCLYKLTKIDKLSYAGGVAYNCVANGKILDKTQFKDIYIQPAAGDAGLAVGAAFYVWHQILDQPRLFVMEHAYWGPEYQDYDIVQFIHKFLNHKDFSIIECRYSDEVVKETARYIADGKIIGWFQGRMEWGPRALGNRSILVDPSRKEMKDLLNKRIKNREPFRPFAPSILEEYVNDYFNQSYVSPFMLMTYMVKESKVCDLQAAINVDNTARIQTVSKKCNPLYWSLINEFRKIKNIPSLLNTSFNENEPIVCSPKEAIDCFIRTNMDVLVLGRYIIKKEYETTND